MARNADMEIGSAWVELTNADTTTITFLNNGPYPVIIKYGADGTLPTDDAGDRYGAGQGERDITPPTSFVRVFARAVDGRSTVGVRAVDV